MPIVTLRTYPLLLSTATVTATFAAAIVLAQVWPDVCWLPRLGGTLVGVSVAIQGYVNVRREEFDVEWRWGLTRGQFYDYYSALLALYGTGVWTFGDLLPTIMWAPNCACLPTC